MKITAQPLLSAADWLALRGEISPSGGAGPLPNLLDRLESMGARSAIIEHDYLDRDFTSEFSSFYSKLFARYSKVCKRVHFFRTDVGSIVSIVAATQLSEQLEAQNTNYLGFIVARPVPHAPIGRTVLAAPQSPQGMSSRLLVRSTHEVHLLGASLSVEGTPLLQQDTRVGSCAQATIWMAGRHFHTKHRGPWFSVNQITEEASKPVDWSLSQSVPAGSTSLSIDNMLRALRAMGREPLERNPIRFEHNRPF